MVITLDSVSELLEDIAIFIQQIEGITIITFTVVKLLVDIAIFIQQIQGITIISEVIGRHHHI